MQSIIFEDIQCLNSKYTFGRGKYGEFNVIIMNNGYINASKLCADGGKRFKCWLENKSSKEIIIAVNEEIQGIAIIKLNNVSNQLKGTYVHELLVNPIVCWISPKFTIFVSKIMNEWKRQNETLYWKEIREGLKDSRSNNLREAEIRDSIAETLNGVTEVKTPAGYIDVLTDTLLIEVKEASLWKHAVGQVLVYSHYYPTHKKVIWLFDYTPNNIVANRINELGIELRY
jgi:hypothetical protein